MGIFGSVNARWFICNVLLSLSVIMIRTSAANDYMPWGGRVKRGLRDREIELLTMLGFAVAVKSRKATSDLELYAMVFKFFHLVNVVMCGLLDLVAIIVYLSLLSFVSIVAPEMATTGHYNVQTLKPYELEAWQNEDRIAGEADQERYALVKLMTLWSPPAQYFAPAFGELSNRYNVKGFRFGQIDVEKYRATAIKYGVDINAMSAQIPTVILFKNGVEVDRVPTVNRKKMVERIKLTADVVEKTFDLPKRLAEMRTVNKKAENTQKTK
eukprot:m.94775 g.94775  ORF g.94775 m.94775 type:complete len:269 (-) comp10070_c0_seq2:195-1001(-)